MPISFGAVRTVTGGQVGPTGTAIVVEYVHLVASNTGSAAYLTIHNATTATAANDQYAYVEVPQSYQSTVYEWGSGLRLNDGCFVVTGTNVSYAVFGVMSDF